MNVIEQEPRQAETEAGDELVRMPMVEPVPGRVSGAPVIVHSRVRPDDLVANREEGPEWPAETYALPLDTVQAVLAFY